MTQCERIAIDASKAAFALPAFALPVFALRGIDRQDRPVLRITLRRARVIPFFAKLPPTEIATQACGGACHWARELAALGRTLPLVPPQHVKPHVERGKNDRNDAEASCEAAGQAGALPSEAKEMAALLGQQIAGLDAKIEQVEVKPLATRKADPASQRLAALPGAGPIAALTLASEIDPTAFGSGRRLAAWIGLTPTGHPTGGKQRMGGISRAGHERLRALLVIGATSAIKAAMQPGSQQTTDWLQAPLRREPRKVAAAALANKMARAARAVMTIVEFNLSEPQAIEPSRGFGRG